jgi:hypothetical protein
MVIYDFRLNNYLNLNDMKRIIIVFIALICIMGCKEEGRLDYIDDSAPAPAPVTLKGTPVSKPGGAVIKYSVPSDVNLLGVKAVYERSGQVCETKASIYTDSLTLEGFNDTKTYDVNLYSVGRNSKLSEPLTVQVTPLEPPYRTVQVDMVETFGGVSVTLSGNDNRASLAMVLLADTTGTNEWIELQTFYTEAVNVSYARRGLESKEYTFALFVRDRWNNLSDTLIKSLMPIEEVVIPKDKFSNPKLPGDSWVQVAGSSNFKFENLWDGIYNRGSGFFAAVTTSPMPQHFTISLGRKVVLSRFQVFPRLDDRYSGPAPRTWELYGSDDPSPDGSWENWHLLGSYSQLKPSGYGDGATVGPVTAEDIEYFLSGGNYELLVTDEIPNPYITISYIRFRTTSTFTTYLTEATNGEMIIGELTFYGQLKNE